MKNFYDVLDKYVLENRPNFGDGESVLTLLYEAYSECNRLDDAQVKEDFNELYRLMNAMAYCWDLETNTRQSKVFSVPHRRHTKSGGYALEDPRDIYELVANQAARRVRSCILSVIPGDVVDAAVQVCQNTLTSGVENVHKKVQQMLDVFREELGITQAAVERFIGRNASAFNPQVVLRLRGVYNAIKEGRARPEDYFGDAPAPAPQLTGEAAPAAQAQGTETGPKKVSLNDL